jgi:starch synthase
MYIAMIASECAPVSKVGGLADVVYGLTRELEIRGNEMEIILPKYDCMRYDNIWGLHVAHQDLWVPWGGGHYSLLRLVWIRAWAEMFLYRISFPR